MTNDYSAIITLPRHLTDAVLDEFMAMRVHQVPGLKGDNPIEIRNYYLSLGNALSLPRLNPDEVTLEKSTELAFEDLYFSDNMDDAAIERLHRMVSQIHYYLPSGVELIKYILTSNFLTYWYCTTDVERAIFTDVF